MADRELSEFVEGICKESHLRVETDLGDGFVRLRSEEAQRRQAVHDIRSTEDIVIEMLRNSRDAHASNIFLSYAKSGNSRQVVIIDDGDGIPKHMHELVFEPRVTSKLDSMHIDKWGVHGRGMALYSVKMNSQSAYVASSGIGLGCAISVDTDTRELGEKADQSSFPRFEKSETGNIAVRGPKNIIRTACEFAIESSKSVTLYAGTPAEIASTLYAFGQATLTQAQLMRYADREELPVCKRLALCPDPESFTEVAASLGLEMSERTARRIIDGEYKPLEPVSVLIARAIVGKPAKSKKPKTAKSSDPINISLDAEDIDCIKDAIDGAWAEIARKYYLDPNVEPSISVTGTHLRISLPTIRE